jgi:hypothetical protein
MRKAIKIESKPNYHEFFRELRKYRRLKTLDFSNKDNSRGNERIIMLFPPPSVPLIAIGMCL